ncbi:MAG: AAA family ATPase [Patescibacteria group bacterium]
MIIIGITGTLGAGKGTVVEYLLNTKGFKHYSARAFITEEISRCGLPVNRDSMVLVGNDLRVQHGPAYVIEELYKQALAAGGDAVIESLRTPGEVAAMRSKANFSLWAVNADIKTRYERVKTRATETDFISFDEFATQEEREMHSDDPNKQNLAECIKQADFVLTNNGSFDELYAQIGKILERI